MKLYHATFVANLEQIEEHGLVPGSRKNWASCEDGFVYLANDPDIAASFCEAAEDVPDDVYESGICCFEVDSNTLNKELLFADPNILVDDSIASGCYVYANKIPFSDLTLIPLEHDPQVDTPALLTKGYIMNALAENDSLTIEDSDANGFLVWDADDAKLIPFRFLENMSAQTLADQIYVSPDIPAKFQVDKALLADYLWNSCDRNTFITLDEVVVIWSEPEDPDTFEPSDFIDSGTKHLYEKFGDEYAYELGEGLLGQLWFERNTVIINMGEIVRAAESIARENEEFGSSYFSLENQTLVGFLTTAIHELRHLHMDTNILLPEDIYPLSLCSEDAVEAYCREAFESSKIQPDILPNLFQQAKTPLSEQISSAQAKVSNATSQNKQQALKSSERNN